MKNRNKILTLLTIATSMLVAGCNTIYARPTEDIKNQELISNVDVDHNTIEWLYDALHENSSTATDVKDALFNVLEKSLFGNVTFKDGDVYFEKFDNTSTDERMQFVLSHKVYWDKAKNTETNDYDYVEPTTVTTTIVDRVNLFRTLIKEQIVKKLFSSANISNYKTRDYFYEIRFARNLAGQHYVIKGFENQQIYNTEFDSANVSNFSNKVLIDNSFTDENIESIIGNQNSAHKPMLHLDLYTDYINKEILPNILETLLIEQYIYDNQYSAISRAHYRKVSYVHINTDNKSVSDGRRLVNKFVEKYIKDPSKSQGKTINYDLLGEAWKGVYTDLLSDGGYNEAGQLLIESGFNFGTPTKDGNPISMFADGESADSYRYFENTAYGNLIENYAKITLNPKTTDSTVESDFTSNGTYPIQTGLEIKTNDIRLNDYTTTAWGTNDSNFASLPADSKTRLFDYTVISDFGEKNLSQNSYLQEINGHYFIKKNVSQYDDETDSIVIKDGSNFYIIEVLEVPSQARLTRGTDDAYDDAKLEEISRRMGYDLASGSTYKNNAFKHYLADCEIIYHDQSIYAYFYSTYTDLFND